MCWDLVIFARKLSHTPRNVKHPRVIKSPQSPHKNPHPAHKYTHHLDKNASGSYNTYSNQRSELMSVVYQQAQKQRYRITLELDVLGDFDPHQLDWEKLFKLEPAERVSAYVEDLSCPDRWWFSAVEFW